MHQPYTGARTLLLREWQYGWIPHNASFGFLDRPRGVLGQIHF
jgi:hypothetical protein